MMKRIELWMMAAVLTLCGTVSAQAQYYDTKNELNISIGAGANSEILSALSDFTSIMASTLVTGIVTGGHYVGYVDYDNESYTPPIAVGYYRHVSKLIAVGGYVGFNQYKRDMIGRWEATDGSSSHKDKIGEAKRTNFSLMPSAKFHWVRTKYFGFYSKVGIGVTFSSEKQDTGDKDYSGSDTFFNYDITPIGLDAGTPQFRAYVELGIGEQGMGCLGLRYKF